MSANDISIPADFEDRYRKTYTRLSSGEVMTQAEIAAALGLPLDVFLSAVIDYAFEMGRASVVVGPMASHSSNRKPN